MLIALLAALCGPAAADAAAPATVPRWSLLTQTTFLHLQQDQGLPNEVVASVTQDGDGFIWAATAVGVARWDGYRFRLYRPGTGQPGVVADGYMQRVHTDPAGRVWVGTSATGLARYDRNSDHFVSYPVGPNGLSHVSVRSIADDGVGGLWVGTDNGLDHLDPASGVVVRAVPVVAKADSSDGLRIRDVMRDRRGRLWVSTQFGLYRRDVAEGPFVEVPLLPAEGAAAGADRDSDRPIPTALFEDGSQRVWIGTVQHGVFIVEADGSPARPLNARPFGSASDDLTFRPVTSMIEVRPGEVWIGTSGGGIVAVDVISGLTRRIRNVPTLPQSLPDDSVLALYRDRSGLVWVAGNLGLSRYDARQSAVLTMFGAPATVSVDGNHAPSQLPLPASTKISWILPTSPQRIWLGTHSGEIHVIDPAGARVSTLQPDAAHPQNALQPDAVLGLEQAPDGSVFIATKRGLYRASADGTRVSRIALAGRDVAASTWALLVDGDTLWIGGQYDGLWQLDLRSGASARLLGMPGRRLTDERIIALAKGPGGHLWIGTRNGLNRYEPATGALLHILPDAARRDGLSSSFVSSLMTDRQDRLWVATYGGGLNILDPGEAASEAPRFRHLSTAEGLHDDNLNSVIEDRAGNVWFSTDNGIGTVDARTGAIRSLRRTEGAAFSIYWTGSAARTAEGELLFGGAGGMTIVRPERVKEWDYSPGIVITEVRVGGKSLPAERFFGAGSLAAAPLTVDADANGLAVEFSAMDFSAPERNRYAYRLDGYDRDWIETSAARRLASYTNLPPGDYRLMLRGSNRDGVWARQDLEVPVRVLPAWHQTLWFRVAAVLATLGLLTVVVRSRTRFLRKQQTELERKVQVRTAELEAVSLALKEKSRVLELTSISDPLTGLRNCRFLTQHIDTEVTASLRRAHDSTSGTPVHPVDTDNVFLIIDIDHFKRVNDVHGHAAGDAVLVQFAQRLQSVMRETDYVVRWGGEEFLAVARNTDRARAEELAERIRAIVADSAFTLDDHRSLVVSCSIGFACLPFVSGEPRALSWQDVVKLADVALLTAKRMGRNGWVGLYAGQAATAEGLLARVHADPLSALARGEIRTASNQPHDQVTDALAPPEPAPAGPPLMA